MDALIDIGDATLEAFVGGQGPSVFSVPVFPARRLVHRGKARPWWC
jgi:hypothetical protein